MNKPIIVERYADNGSLRHYALIQEETGEILWSEAPEEEIQQVKNCSIPDFIKSFTDEQIKRMYQDSFGNFEEWKSKWF